MSWPVASQQLVGGVDELHRAAKDLARQETQLLLKEGELAKMRTSVLAASGEIDAIRQALAELAAKRNAGGNLLQLDGRDIMKQLEALSEEIEKLRAK